MKMFLFFIGCLLLIFAGVHFGSGIEIWKGYVSLFIGLGSLIIICFKDNYGKV